MWRTNSLKKTLMLGKIEGERDDRGWEGWMGSPMRWTWVWASSRSWWRTGKPGLLQSKGSQRVRHNRGTELTWNVFNQESDVIRSAFEGDGSPGGGHRSPLQYSCLENTHGLRSLVGYSSWGCKDSDMTAWLSTVQRRCNGILIVMMVMIASTEYLPCPQS